METKEKVSKLIGIGNEGIEFVNTLKNKVEKNVSINSIAINQDVDKDFVRTILDGIDILFLAYSGEDKRSKEVVKAISFMAQERRVLSIGLNTKKEEKKDDLGVNREIEVSFDEDITVNLINAITESISEECMINIDITDLKEVLAGEKGLSYSYKEFKNNISSQEIANKLLEEKIEVGKELSKKRGLVLVDMDKNYIDQDNMLTKLYEILTSIESSIDNSYEMIFSLSVGEQTEETIRICAVYN